MISWSQTKLEKSGKIWNYLKSAVFNYQHNTIITLPASFVGSKELKEKIAYENITTCNNKNELPCSTLKENRRGRGEYIPQPWEVWPEKTSISWNGILRCQCTACLEKWALLRKSRPAGRLDLKQLWPREGENLKLPQNWLHLHGLELEDAGWTHAFQSSFTSLGLNCHGPRSQSSAQKYKACRFNFPHLSTQHYLLGGVAWMGGPALASDAQGCAMWPWVARCTVFFLGLHP